jgi:inhibitor of KinA sporulation pathway (predicted exonuclease)
MNNIYSNYLAFDLELDQPGCEIIQIGAVIFNLETEQILDRKIWYIQLSHPLNPFITNLTGITDEILKENGISLLQAYQELSEMHKKYECFVNPVTWGGGDHSCLRKALNIGDNDRWAFGRREIDAKTVFQSWRRSQRQPVQGGLAKSLTKLGLAFQGRKHDAGCDAEQTARIYMALLKKFRA